MSLYRKHGKPEFHYDFTIQGRRFSKSTGTGNRREATRIEAQAKREAQEQTRTARQFVSSGPMTFEIASSRYWHEVGEHLANKEDCFRYLGWLINFFGKSTTLDNVTDSLVAAMVAKRRVETHRGKRLSLATVNRSTVVPLRGLMLRARKSWKVPVAEINWGQHLLKEVKEIVREASRDEEARVVAAMRDDYAPAVRFAFLTGCRRMEVVNLTWSRIDMAGRTITIIGKRDKTRVIPMTTVVYELLIAELGVHPTAVFTYRVRKTRKDRGLVRGERRPITMEGFKTAWRRYKGLSGVENFRFHDTRHTAATRTLRASNLKVVQQMLGHSDIATTVKYAHAMLDDVRAAMEAANHTESPTSADDAVVKTLNLDKKSA
ncbi:site-specific integrase [Mesorhizobium sp. LHD-90]|uniref:tyrosine-type recombinase/integrase n=1 Tax=Mesorhizobium sp. LHD-90 TaxID=3071414 RepID=UPI0027E0B2B6|nr:site-specific integrase [Mesorhizobium sp. LHD-90]MDQ6434349.1 site-specific integrase [Mesorhizobium sp. LHD-90]